MKKQQAFQKITGILKFIFVDSDIKEVDSELTKIIDEFDSKIREYILSDSEIRKFFKSKKNFPNNGDLVIFGNNVVKKKIVSEKRADIERELTIACIEKKLDIDFLQRNIKTETKSIENQAAYWYSLSEVSLEKELNDIEKYPTADSLKHAAGMLLDSKQKKWKTRDKIVQAIKKAVKEQQAIMGMGK